ncbi:MAG: RidA family protein [Deltaproteobacteria bacterium]|nr:RidA family protein [Deltaproteobacteria bacterium]
MRTLISSGSSFERDWGYSRAVVDGDEVFVSGTTGFDYAAMTIASDPAVQTRQAFANIEAALAQAGASLADVVRVRYYVPDAADWPAIAAVCGERLGDIRPAATAIVCGLVDARMRIEIEVTARRRAPR